MHEVSSVNNSEFAGSLLALVLPLVVLGAPRIVCSFTGTCYLTFGPASRPGSL